MDGNYMFNQKSEKLAFSHDIIVPSCKPDVRQDTTWIDTLHIKSIAQVDYTHFYPDDIVLRAFTETLTDRYFLKSERKEPNNFSLFFSYGDSNPARRKHVLYLYLHAYGVENSADNQAITFFHIHRSHFLVTIRNISNQRLQRFHGFGYLPCT